MIQIQNHFDAIADGLAEHGYAIVDEFLSPSQVDAILYSDLFSETNLKKSGIGKTNHQINESIRGDYTKWIDKASAILPIQDYLNQVDALRVYLNESLFLSLKDFEAHLAMYPAGSFYKKHLDQFKTDDHRRITVIAYLNPDWQEEHGGQLRMYLDGSHLDIYPIAGRLICFRSDQIEHEVLTTTRTRLSITGWMLDQISDLRHL